MTTLYWYWTTNPQKVRLAIEECIINHNLVKVHLGKWEHRIAEYQTIPKTICTNLVFKTKLTGSMPLYWPIADALELLPPVDTPEYAQSLNTLLFMEACTFQRWADVHFMEQIIHPLIGRPPLQKISDIPIPVSNHHSTFWSVKLGPRIIYLQISVLWIVPLHLGYHIWIYQHTPI